MKSKCFIATLLAGVAILGFCNTGAGVQFSMHKNPLHPAGPATHAKAGVQAPSSKPHQFQPEKAIRLLPDLVVERIWLNRGYIAFSIKNAGKGAIPDRQHQSGKVNVTYGGKTQACAFTRKINGNAPVDPKGILKSAGRAITYTTGIKPGSSARTISVTVFVDNTRQVHEQNERNNSKTVRLSVPHLRVAAKTVGKTALKPGIQHAAPMHMVSSRPRVSIEKIYLHHGTLHVRLRNGSKTTLTRAQLRSVKLHLSMGSKARTWYLAGIYHGRHLLRPGGYFDFDTGLRVAARTNVHARLEGVRGHSWRSARLAPALQAGGKTRAPVTKGKPATRDLKMLRVAPIQRAPGTGPWGNLQVGPHYFGNLRRARDVFGESNDTFENAYRLTSLNRTYQAACHSREDEDYYKFTLPSSGAGSWVQITVQSIDPASHEFRLILMGPDGGGWEGIYDKTSGRLWVAGVPGLTVYIHISSGNWFDTPDSECVLDYNLTLQSQVIPDAAASVADDSNGLGQATISIYPGETKGPYYMAQVGDADFHARKTWDAFKFTWRACRHYCVFISRGGEIAICDDHGCTGAGQNEPVTRACTDTCEEKGHTAYIGVKATGDEDGGMWPFVGTGPLPARYTQPYTIFLIDAGDCRSFDDLGSCD